MECVYGTWYLKRGPWNVIMGSLNVNLGLWNVNRGPRNVNRVRAMSLWDVECENGTVEYE